MSSFRPMRPSEPEVRGTLVVRSVPSSTHDCLGEEVVLRLLDEERGRILSSERCDQNSSGGCDGVPTFRPGEIVVLPVGWRDRPESPLRVEELRAWVDRP